MLVAPHLCVRAPFAPILLAASRAAAVSEMTSCRRRRKISPLSCQPSHLAPPPHPRVRRPLWSDQNQAGLMPSPAATRPLSSWCVKAHSEDFRPSARRILPSRGSCHSVSMICHPHYNARQISRPRTLRWTWDCLVREIVV